MAQSSPKYRFGGHYISNSRMHVDVLRVDGSPEGGPFGLRTSPHGLELDEVLDELRALIARMRAYGDPEPVELPHSPRMLSIGGDRFLSPFDGSGEAS